MSFYGPSSRERSNPNGTNHLVYSRSMIGDDYTNAPLKGIGNLDENRINFVDGLETVQISCGWDLLTADPTEGGELVQRGSSFVNYAEGYGATGYTIIGAEKHYVEISHVTDRSSFPRPQTTIVGIAADDRFLTTAYELTHHIHRSRIWFEAVDEDLYFPIARWIQITGVTQE